MTPVTSSLPTIKRSQASSTGEKTHQAKSSPINGGSSIGAILIDTGRLSAENAERIAGLQIEQGKRFGATAVELGLLTEDDVRFALSRQFDNVYLPASDTSLDHQLVAAYKPFSLAVETSRLTWSTHDALVQCRDPSQCACNHEPGFWGGEELYRR